MVRGAELGLVFNYDGVTAVDSVLNLGDCECLFFSREYSPHEDSIDQKESGENESHNWVVDYIGEGKIEWLRL